MTSSVADALVGRLIDGRYRILSHLADGGMASVYVAMDARLDREVAVKIMRPGLATDDVFVERFRSEARSAARLSHPNVVAVFDQGEDRGDVFLAMELVEGKTLRDVIHEEAPLTARESLAILEPILQALRAAHAAGIIHRDVKPENVIVRHDGEVKVADFGLARAITNQTSTSQTGVLLGTVSYLSPEQVERGVADQRSDVYAAGLLLFEMLTGRKAVTGDTPIQIAYKHVHGSIPAPSSVVDTVPGALDTLVAHATAVEPDDRFDSAAAFVVGLRDVRRGLTPAELDRRGELAPDTGPGATASGSSVPWAATTAMPITGAVGNAASAGLPRARGTDDGDTKPFTTMPFTTMAPGAASGVPAPARRTGDGSRPRIPLTGRPVDDDRPDVQHTAALPIHQRRTRRRWPLWLAGVLLVLGGSGAAWWFTAGPGGTTVVPSLVGQQLVAADASLDRASLRPEAAEEFSETAAKGVVMRVEPDAGSEVGKQSIVRLVVSKGKERYAAPRLVGTKASAAARALSPLTLVVGDTEEAWDEAVPKGVVVSQDPVPGSSLRRGERVSIVVSKGRQPIDVPNVRGLGVDAASAKITGNGLKAARAADVNSDTVPAGQVVSQSPATGTLFRGDTVTVVVSKGPVMVQVPNVVARSSEEAAKTLTDLGFAVKKETGLFGSVLDIVQHQSVKAGDSAPKGSTIVLTIV